MRRTHSEHARQDKKSLFNKVTYVAPAVVTLAAMPSFASAGSARGNNGVGNGLDPQPPGNPPIKDSPGTALG